MNKRPARKGQYHSSVQDTLRKAWPARQPVRLMTNPQNWVCKGTPAPAFYGDSKCRLRLCGGLLTLSTAWPARQPAIKRRSRGGVGRETAKATGPAGLVGRIAQAESRAASTPALVVPERPEPLSATPEVRRCGWYSLFCRLRSCLYKLRGSQARDSASAVKDLLWSSLGAFAGILLLAQLDRLFFTGELLEIGSFGASSLIIFGAPHSDFAQPRSVVGGQVLSACAGVVAYYFLGAWPLLSAPAAVALAFAAMQISKTLHPPGGATALIAGSGQQVALQMGFFYPLVPVGVGIGLLFLVGVLVNNLSRNRQYPLKWY